MFIYKLFELIRNLVLAFLTSPIKTIRWAIHLIFLMISFILDTLKRWI